MRCTLVTVRELALTRLLTATRALPARLTGRGDAFPKAHRAAVRVNSRAGFCVFNGPGYVLIATSFECQPDGDGTRFYTEARVQPTDERVARRFRPYWLAIRAGSGLIRPRHAAVVRRLAERSS